MEPIASKDHTSSHILEYVPGKKSTLHSMVSLYRNKLALHPTAQKILDCLILGGISFASLGAAIPLVCKIKDLSFRADQEREAEKFSEEMKSPKKASPCPPRDPIQMKTPTRTFTHIEEYAIENNFLWHRPRAQSPEKVQEWKPLFFDGTSFGRTPTSLSADGANLVVIDDKGMVHYRKVLIEGRGYEQIQSKQMQRHLRQHREIEIEKEDTSTYVAIDKSEKVNWKPCWYSFPVVNRIINLITGKKLPSSGVISHRGRFTYGFEDAAGQFHKSEIGVTTLYELGKDGRTIQKHDPWAPSYSNVQLYFPETEDSAFVASAYDASASTIVSLGYEINAKTKSARIKILTNFCDIDTLGNNPLLRYSYNPSDVGARILPEIVKNEGWEEHALPDDVKEFFSAVTVTQTGIGSKARELRIAARNKAGQEGYYKKNLQDGKSWEFVACAIDTSKPLALSKEWDKKIDPKVHSYTGSTSNEKGIPIKITLEHFGEHGYHSVLRLNCGGKSFDLQVHKRLGWKTFLGIQAEFYDLVIPQEIKDPKLLEMFGGRRCISCKFKVTDQGVQISMHGKHPKIPLLR